MTTFPGSPRVVQGAFVILDPRTLAISKIIAFPYNPEMLTRRLEAATVLPPGSGASPRQVITFTVPLDATDQLENPDQNPVTVQSGVHPLLSAIELLTYPPNSLENALTIFVWGKNRVMPVRVAQLQVVEQLFDPALNPIRAEISVTLSVRTEADFPADSPGRKLWDEYLANLERLAGLAPGGTLGSIGLSGI